MRPEKVHSPSGADVPVPGVRLLPLQRLWEEHPRGHPLRGHRRHKEEEQIRNRHRNTPQKRPRKVLLLLLHITLQDIQGHLRSLEHSLRHDVIR